MTGLTSKIHTPVLLNELIAGLQVKPNGLYVDCTAGFGGHSSEIANQLKLGLLTCIDQDVNAINHLNKLFKDCLSCSDCEFCFPHDLDNFICAGNNYGKINLVQKNSHFVDSFDFIKKFS